LIFVFTGTHIECVYALMTYGIPSESFPVTVAGEVKRKKHLEWIKMRKRQESDNSGQPRIVIPSYSDILFGRGKPFREHIGNLQLVNLLDDHLDRYEAVKLKEKSAVIAEMVYIVKKKGGRFLKQEKGVWVEADEKMAREKVSHGFRTRIRIVSSNQADEQQTRGKTLHPDMSTSRIDEKKRARLFV
jgi:hypothetical protein